MAGRWRRLVGRGDGGSRLGCGRWHVLLRGVPRTSVGGPSVDLRRAVYFNFLPTTVGGDLIRLAGAFQLEIDRALSVASLIVDRLVGMAGMAIPLPLGLVSLAGALQAAPFAPLSQPVAAAAGAASGTWAGKAGGWLRSAARRLWAAHQALGRTTGVTGFGARLHPGPYGLSVCASIYILLRAMGEPMSFFTIAGLWSMVYFVTLFPISINGLGLQEVALTVAFTQLGGTSTQAALLLAVCLRTLAMLASLPGALFIGKILPRARQEAASHKELAHDELG